MARIRSIKPGFWDHEQLGRLSPLARLTFVGMWSLADDEGRGRGDPHALWGDLHKYSGGSTRAQWSRALTELRDVKDDRGSLVIFYSVAGAAYYWIPGFKRQQRIDKPQASTHPAPPNSESVPRTVEDESTLDRRGEERIGGEGRGVDSAPAPELPPPAETPEPSDEDREVDRTVAAFGFCASPGIQSKRNAVMELRRVGQSHEFIRSIARKQEQKTFYEIIRSIEKGKAVPDFKPTPPARPKCKNLKCIDGRIIDQEKTTPLKTAWKPCPDCGPPGVTAATG